MKLKNLFSLMLSALLVVTASIIICASAYAGTSYLGTCGETASWTLDDSGLLVISGSGKITAPESQEDKDLWAQKVTGIKIEDSISEISSGTFSYCNNLKKVQFSSSVSTIEEGAFGTIEADAYAVSEAWIENIYTTSSLEYLYYTVDNGTCGDGVDWKYDIRGTLTISGEGRMNDYKDESPFAIFDFETINFSAGVTYIGAYAFKDCASLTTVEIPDTILEIGLGAFSGCEKISKIRLPFVGASASSTNSHIGYIFGAKTYLDNGDYLPVNLSVEIDYVTKISDYAAYGCASITEFKLPSSLESIGTYAFSSCSSVKKFEIPSSVKSIGYSAFSDCISLQNITLPFVGGSSLEDKNTHFGYIFGASTYKDNCLVLPEKLSVTITGGTKVDNYAFYSCQNISKITLPSTILSIGKYAFYDCDLIKSVTIPSNVTSVGDYAFYDCALLSAIGIGSKVKSIGAYAFYGCEKITTVSLPINLQSIGKYAFSYCTSLKAIYIPKNITAIEEGTFECCSALASVTLTKSLLSIGAHAFSNCIKLSSISLPSALTSIGEQAFCNCALITKFNVPATVTSIGYGAFESCTGVTSLTLPFVGGDSSGTNGIAYILAAEDQYAMANYKKLETIIINGGEKIAGAAFSGLLYVKNLTLPSTLKTIGASAFDKCYSLTNIYVKSLDAWLGISFANEYSTPMCYAKNLYVGGVLLESILLPEETTSLNDYVFSGWKTLKDVEIQPLLQTIGSNSFKNCNLKVYYQENSKAKVGQYGGTLNWILIGDLELDGQVNSDDAIRLLMHTQFPDDPIYSIDQEVDYNGDGQINSDDAIYLLLHTHFNTDYPLDPKKYRAK